MQASDIRELSEAVEDPSFDISVGKEDDIIRRVSGRVEFEIPKPSRAGLGGLDTVLWWLIVAAGRAPFVPLWDQQGWHRWVVNVAMPLAVALGCLGVAAPNPFAFEGRPGGFDPDHPGIAGVTRQPLLWALALWAGAHLLANGDLAHVIVFAPFAGLAIIGMPVVESRRRRAMGAAAWHRQTARTALVPGAALLAGRWSPGGGWPLGRLALAVVIWAALWHLHLPLIGVWPAP